MTAVRKLCTGLGAALLLLSAGKIAGISGIFSGFFENKKDDRQWRIIFLLGLLTSALIWIQFWPEKLTSNQDPSWIRLVLSGFLVGFGARLSGGCTSGHGICGLARFSRRSITATCVFLMTAVLTVYIIRVLYAS
jgi:uncharacterized membrane protein YedE/YeeE